MIYISVAIGLILLVSIIVYLYFRFSPEKKALRLQKKQEKQKRLEDIEAQRLLDEYKNSELTGVEVGKLYERYIGYLYEQEGYDVQYNGAVNGYKDLGRDLIVKTDDEIYIVQTKRWANRKTIKEKHIFQLFGSMTHFKQTSDINGYTVKAVFFTSAKFTNSARKAAEVLGVELVIKSLDSSYPMIKCNISQSGEKIYHLPMDPYYDKIKIRADQGNFYVHTVEEAAKRGFRRAQNYKYAA